MSDPIKRPRGFAAMTPEKRRMIASLGGKRAAASGKCHRWTKETAQQAGLKGGAASGRKRKATG